MYLDCRVWQSYFLLFKSVFLTKQRILQSSPSVVLDGLSAFGVIELVGGLIFFKNLTTHKCLLSVWWCLFWFCQPPDGLLASPSLWASYCLVQWTATNFKFNTWIQLQMFYLLNFSWNNVGTGLTGYETAFWSIVHLYLSPGANIILMWQVIFQKLLKMKNSAIVNLLALIPLGTFFYTFRWTDPLSSARTELILESGPPLHICYC